MTTSHDYRLNTPEVCGKCKGNLVPLFETKGRGGRSTAPSVVTNASEAIESEHLIPRDKTSKDDILQVHLVSCAVMQTRIQIFKVLLLPRQRRRVGIAL